MILVFQVFQVFLLVTFMSDVFTEKFFRFHEIRRTDFRVNRNECISQELMIMFCKKSVYFN